MGNIKRLLDAEIEMYKVIEEAYRRDWDSLPNGTISFKRRGRKYIAYHVYKDGERWKQASLGKGDPKTKLLIDQLIYKRFLKELKTLVKQNRSIIEQAAECRELDIERGIVKSGAQYRMPPKVRELISEITGGSDQEEFIRWQSGNTVVINWQKDTKYNIEQAEKWMRERNGPMKEFYEGDRKIDTGFGFYVRSKSELLIVFALVRAGIPFRYEDALKIDGVTLHPDFTILLPDGRTVIWEHFGLMSKPEYREDAKRRMERYIRNDFRPCENFFATYEDGDSELDGSEISRIIEAIAKL